MTELRENRAAKRGGLEAKNAVVGGLRDIILRGDMSPGQRLVEADIIDMFGVTRGSVRAAIEDLASEGIVERIPNRGARVRSVSVVEAVSILECRSVLEGLIAARAAERISEQQREELAEIGRLMKQAVETGELADYSRLNSRLHAYIAEVAQQETASNLIHRLRSQIVRHQFQLSMRSGRPQVSLPQHLAIIEAVSARDPERAEQAARRHVESVIHALKNFDSLGGELETASRAD